MVNTQQTSTTVATASVGLYEHVEDSQELLLLCVCTHCKCASDTNARCV